MVYLLEKCRKHFHLYCPEIFGMETWGMGAQESLEKKRKNWYIVYWRGAVYEDQDDYVENIKLNIVLETKKFSDIKKYILKHNKNELESILAEKAAIDEQYGHFMKWVIGSRKKAKKTVEEAL